MLGTVRKRPDDQLDYDVEFDRWLPDGDTIQDATATVEPAGVTVDQVQYGPGFDSIVKVWLSGGVAGTSYKITVTTSTAEGRVKEVAFNLRVAEC